MAKTLRISALQLAAHDRDAFPARRDALLARIDKAAADCELLVLPEATFPAYVLGDAGIDDAQIARVLSELSGIAQRRRCVIAAGAAIRRDGELFNSAVVFDSDGSIAGTADKSFLWHFDRKWFAPSRRIVPIQSSLGRLGVLVCADGRMPAIARALVDRGAELLVMPTAWVTSGRDPAQLENIQADLLARVRAFENGVPFVAANKCGVERSMVAYCGKSQIVDADGTVIAIADGTSEAIVSANVALHPPHPFRSAPLEIPHIEAAQPPGPVRVAISIDPLPPDIQSRLQLLDADVAVTPQHPDGIDFLNSVAPTIALDAAAAFDPGALIAARMAGVRIAVLEARATHAWLAPVARARALELRIYVIVLDREAGRAYAIDPDGAVIAGTFGDYTLASFGLDVRRTSETAVAPGTDIAAGLQRINQLLEGVRAT